MDLYLGWQWWLILVALIEFQICYEDRIGGDGWSDDTRCLGSHSPTLNAFGILITAHQLQVCCFLLSKCWHIWTGQATIECKHNQSLIVLYRWPLTLETAHYKKSLVSSSWNWSALWFLDGIVTMSHKLNSSTLRVVIYILWDGWLVAIWTVSDWLYFACLQLPWRSADNMLVWWWLVESVYWKSRPLIRQTELLMATEVDSEGQSASSSKSASSGPRCSVCGDDASGFHYGVDSCEGCKVIKFGLFICSILFGVLIQEGLWEALQPSSQDNQEPLVVKTRMVEKSAQRDANTERWL